MLSTIRLTAQYSKVKLLIRSGLVQVLREGVPVFGIVFVYPSWGNEGTQRREILLSIRDRW